MLPTGSTGDWGIAVLFAQCLPVALPKRQKNGGCFPNFNHANLVTYKVCYLHCYRHLNLLFRQFVWRRRGNSAVSPSVVLLPQRSYRPWLMGQHIPAFLLQMLNCMEKKKTKSFFCYSRSHCQPFPEHRLDWKVMTVCWAFIKIGPLGRSSVEQNIFIVEHRTVAWL